ncbi:collagen-like protein [Lactiplantibacillus plantarum]|uniref:collagen-like protein n=1 Tax=Lactiplantibacillus plantarum TaxID=1590 RepID=UPI002D76F1FE|nr:collagen-like protein [Lactiplantibacillus plantarum]
MVKTLDFAYGTPHEVKVGDDETTFTLVCKNEDLLVDLTTAKSITAKIGNRSGYLREKLINIDSLSKLPTGQFKFNFDNDTLANFPTGNYFLEVWVTDNQGTSIYPSGSPLNFTVTANIENSSGASITTIAFDDFVKAINKAASTIAKGDPGEGLDIKGQVTSVSALPATANEGDGYLVNEELYVYTSGAWKDCGTIQGPQGIQGKTGTGISSTTIQYQISNSATTAPTGIWSNNIVATTTTNPYLWTKATLNYTDGTTKDFYLVSQKGDKGDKGDTGTVDNTGLISAPAFQSLQTQVDNSAVGTNLLMLTANNSSLIGTNTLNQTIYKYSLANGYNASSLASALGTKFTVSFDWSVSGDSPSGIFTVQWNTTPWDINPAGIAVSSSNTSGHTSNAFSVSADSKNLANMIGFRLDNFVGTLTISNVKLEKGSAATDWCPNPAEILTQSDYAKIKAAIVALGGSLS